MSGLVGLVVKPAPGGSFFKVVGYLEDINHLSETSTPDPVVHVELAITAMVGLRVKRIAKQPYCAHALAGQALSSVFPSEIE